MDAVSNNPHLPLFMLLLNTLLCHSILCPFHVVLGTGHDVWSASTWSRLRYQYSMHCFVYVLDWVDLCTKILSGVNWTGRTSANKQLAGTRDR